MYRNTRFGEVMKGLSRSNFEKIVDRFGNDKHTKGFRSWDQLIAMVYAQLSGCRSLRELEAGFNSQTDHYYHLGSRSVKRSTLADANRDRDSGVFAEICNLLMKGIQRTQRAELTDLLYLIDSTPIPLKGRGYDDWTKDNTTRRTQGLKVHMMYKPKSNLPVHTEISAPNINDIEAGRRIGLEAGATYVFDKGYCDYNWWYQIHQRGAYFVTRFKKNAGVVTEKSLEIEEQDNNAILTDEQVGFKHRRPGGKRINDYYGTALRRIVVDRPDKDTPLVLVTNDFERSAQEIAELYRRRWGIELFFKWLKQNLKIKCFLGRSKNAVKTQIYTALIAYILAELYRRHSGIKQTLTLCLVELRTGLLQRPRLDAEEKRRRQRWRVEHQTSQGVLAL